MGRRNLYRGGSQYTSSRSSTECAGSGTVRYVYCHCRSCGKGSECSEDCGRFGADIQHCFLLPSGTERTFLWFYDHYLYSPCLCHRGSAVSRKGGVMIYDYILVMSGVTYLIRMLPLTLFQKKINNIYIKSFLYYIPYACLTAMTFPAILYATESPVSALAGFTAAVILAMRKKSLVTVAVF